MAGVIGGGGGAVLLFLRLEHRERRSEGRGDVAQVGQRGVTAAVLRDELHLLPEELRQLRALPELLYDSVSLVGGRRGRRRRRHLGLGPQRHGGIFRRWRRCEPWLGLDLLDALDNGLGDQLAGEVLWLCVRMGLIIQR